MLPGGMDETLPPQSWRLEDLRRQLLDDYRAAGYDLVLPPMIEHLDTLLGGASNDLERQTFKLVDPASGRLLGFRADMTPQAARIAARRFPSAEVVRLCYLGTVLRIRPDSPGGTRSPRQAGCELFGDASLDADLEIIRLMLGTVARAGIAGAHLDLGHAGIYRALTQPLGLDPADEGALFDILQRKSRPDLDDFASARGLDGLLAPLAGLMELNGDAPSVLARAREVLSGQPGVVEALDLIERAVASLDRGADALPIYLDLAELRGSRYHTGLVFAVFVPGHGREIARGGRYDGTGRVYDRSRPATGFSADINELLSLGEPTSMA